MTDERFAYAILEMVRIISTGKYKGMLAVGDHHTKGYPVPFEILRVGFDAKGKPKIAEYKAYVESVEAKARDLGLKVETASWGTWTTLSMTRGNPSDLD
jgi:hypothetical protein